MSTMRMRLPRFTIERLRTLVLIGAALLIAAIGIFLGVERMRLSKQIRDLPGRLGIDIQQSANGVDYTQTRKGKTLFKMHAARAVQLKLGGKSILHDVRIDLYGEDGKRADTISGSEFEYDPSAGVAHAAGAVEISIMRPGARPAIADLAPGVAPQKALKPAVPLFPAAAGGVTDNEIHVKTSGLTFNQKTQVATTDQRVDFVLRQGKGNAIGATYNASEGQLILDHAVELVAYRNTGRAGSEPVTVHAAHGEFRHEDQQCTLLQARADFTGGSAQAFHAQIDFRDDGSVVQMRGTDGVDLTTKTGAHVTAPRGTLDFDEHNHPHTGLLEGGTQLALNQPLRQVEGNAASARLLFNGEGDLSHAHLERGVTFHARQQGKTAKGAPTEAVRTWASQSADLDFATVHGLPGSSAASGSSSAPAHQTRTEPRMIHGFGGVVVTSETHADGRILPSRLSADTVIAELAPGSTLSNLTGTGHASFEQRTAQGAHQATTSDQLEVHFLPVSPGKTETNRPAQAKSQPAASGQEASQIESMHQSGHVVLTQDAAPGKSGSPAQPPLRATADHSDYDGKTEMLHLEGSPRVVNGSVELTARTIDFVRATSDVFAHGNVKASWSSANAQSQPLPGTGLLSSPPVAGRPDPAANGPVHAIAAEAEMHESSQEVVLRAAADASGEPRLWQAGSSVTAPLIVLNRQKMTLQAQASGAVSPVITVMLGRAPASPASAARGQAARASRGASAGKSGPETQSTIRIRSGDLHYSEAERLALFHAGALGSVTATSTENGEPATVVSQVAEVRLSPAGTHPEPQAGARGGAVSATLPGGVSNAGVSNGGVDTMTAQGRVTVDWPGRHGTGEKLLYRSEDGTYTLTGTGSAPPRMTDRDRGAVTGSALIYHSRDETITVEGEGTRTSTDTRLPK